MRKELIYETESGEKLFAVINPSEEVVAYSATDLFKIIDALKEDIKEDNPFVHNYAVMLLANIMHSIARAA